MAYTTFDRYLESEVLSADPVKLVNMLYRGATDAVASARRALAEGSIADRSKQLMKAWEILHELSQVLDHEKGGELAQRLAALYEYMQSRLLEANAEQKDAPLAEVEGLLVTLGEAWRELSMAQQAAVPAMTMPVDEYRPVSAAY
jgi:flagellar protein FliS